MAIENLFTRNPVFITNGRVKRKALDLSDLSYLSNPVLLEAVAQGEQKIDRFNNVGLFTDMPYYPLAVSLSKALSAQKALAALNGGAKDKTYAVFDATWATRVEGENRQEKFIYINKPGCHPNGSIAGVKTMVDFIIKNSGRNMYNASSTVFFTLGEIITMYELISDLGRIAPIVDQDKQSLLGSIYGNRHTVAGGLNILNAWDLGVIEKPEKVTLDVRQYKVFKEDVRQLEKEGKLINPFLTGRYETKLDYNEQLNDLFLSWALGILPKGLVFPLSA